MGRSGVVGGASGLPRRDSGAFGVGTVLLGHPQTGHQVLVVVRGCVSALLAPRQRDRRDRGMGAYECTVISILRRRKSSIVFLHTMYFGAACRRKNKYFVHVSSASIVLCLT